MVESLGSVEYATQVKQSFDFGPFLMRSDDFDEFSKPLSIICFASLMKFSGKSFLEFHNYGFTF